MTVKSIYLFFPVLVNSMAGVVNIDQVYFDAALGLLLNPLLELVRRRLTPWKEEQ